jgi:hypothetical protein
LHIGVCLPYCLLVGVEVSIPGMGIGVPEVVENLFCKK